MLGCGRTTPLTPKQPRSLTRHLATAMVIWLNAAASTAANGIGPKFCIANELHQRFLPPHILGLNWPTSYQHILPAISIRTLCPGVYVPPDTRPCTTMSGAVCPARISWLGWIPHWLNCATDTLP